MKIYFFTLLISVFLVASCTTTNLSENENRDIFPLKDKNSDSVVLTQPNEITEPKIDYKDLSGEMQGGIVNVKIDNENFAEKDYIFETIRTENVIDYDENTKTVNIMVANYQNTDTNLVITAIGDKKGKFPIVSSPKRSATVTFYYNNGLASLGGSLASGTLFIDIFDEQKGHTRGRIVGKTKEGIPVEADFNVFSK